MRVSCIGASMAFIVLVFVVLSPWDDFIFLFGNDGHAEKKYRKNKKY